MPAPPQTLELALPPGSVARLLRSPALAMAPATAGVPVALAWHDTPDGSLAAQGRALCEGEDGWLLEETRPAPGNALPPGSAARAVRSAASLADLGLAEAGSLRQVAAFTGVVHRAASGSRAVEVLDGNVSARGADHPTCRVRLRGVSPASAASLAEALPLAVPGDALPGFAVRCATGGALPEPGRANVTEGSVRSLAGAVIAGLAAGVVFWASRVAGRGADDVVAIHQARVAIRRTRSALRLLRPATACADVHAVEADLQAAFATLGGVRDWDVFLEWCAAEAGAAVASDQGLPSLLSAARQQRARACSRLQRHLATPAWRAALVRLAAVATLRPWADDGDEARQRLLDEDAAGFARSVLRRARRKLLATGAPGGLPEEELHALRRRCKRMRYAAEVFAPLFPAKPARRFLRCLARVQDTMGRINDLAVAAHLASSLAPGRPFAAGAVTGWASAMGSTARRTLGPDWDALREAEPFWA